MSSYRTLLSHTPIISPAVHSSQADAAAPPPEKGARPAKAAAGDQGKDDKEPSTLTSKIRSVLVAASVVVIVLGSFKMAMSLLDGGSSAPPVPAAENTTEPQGAAKPPADSADKPATPDQVTPS